MSADIEPAPAAAPAESSSAPNRAWCSKMIGFLPRKRHRVTPGRVELPDCDFVNVAPRRTLRVLRPELKSGRFYETPTPSNRPESINDNFYSRWAHRPHPSGNCRCSFRQSSGSRLSSHEEKIISQEIQRIRTSLCEAEKSGTDIQELEKSLAVDLTQLDTEQPVEISSSSGRSRLEPLEEHVKQRIVRDLDRYISDLLDEILNDTIRAIAQADNPFEKRERREQERPAAAFDINFSFHNSDDGDKPPEAKDKPEDKGYVNQGFVGSASDPETLDFHLRRRLNGDVILENADCIDSGINSVETIELQPEQEQNLEQSLIDIIDAKLGGACIGKSLEDLGMEIDATDEAKTSGAKEREVIEVPEPAISEAEEKTSAEVRKSKGEEKRVTIKETPANSLVDQRTSKFLDDAIEEPVFNSLRLEFKRNSSSSSNISISEKQPAVQVASSVSSRVNRTVCAIRQRLAIRVGNSRRKSSDNGKSGGSGGGSSSSRALTWSSLELEDYRRRFPVPENRHRHQFEYDSNNDEVTLRNRNRKPTIVFLHGFGSSADAFEQQLRYFANLGYPCLAPDLLGHGLSSAPSRSRHYQFARLLKDLETVLLHYAFKPGQKCVIVAHNYGCSFATALAQKYVSNVHQLVLISGGGPTPLAPPPSEGTGRCCLRAVLAPLLVCGMQRAVLYSARGRQHPYCGGEEREDQRPSHMRHVLRGMCWPDGDYVFHRRICTPTLLVHGLRDNLVSLVQECQMERTMVKAFLEAIPAAGHIPMIDCPEQLNHMIHCFIDLWKNKKW